MDEIERQFKETAAWTDERLTAELLEAASNERRSLIALLIRLGEFDRRQLPESKGYPSAFEYCTRILKYSRAGAYRRIAVARKGRRFRSLLRMIGEGEICLSAATMLAPLLTSENHQRLLQRASGKSKEEVERIVAALNPKQPPRDMIRIVAAPSLTEIASVAVLPVISRASEDATALGSPDSLLPALSQVSVDAKASADPDLFGQYVSGTLQTTVNAEIYEFRFAASKTTIDMIARAKEILRHRFPNGETDAVIGLALSELLDRHDRDRRKSGPEHRRPTTGNREGLKRSRYIPESVKQTVHERDGGRCVFIGSDGVRCESRAWLEFDHKLPYALGGSSDQPEGLRQFCRPHNLLAGRRAFGGPYFQRE